MRIPKKGDILVCVADDSQDEDLGMSGLVLKGNRDLLKGKEYMVEWVDKTNVPKKNTHWSKAEFPEVQLSWMRVSLEGVGKLQWLKNFTIKE